MRKTVYRVVVPGLLAILGIGVLHLGCRKQSSSGARGDSSVVKRASHRCTVSRDSNLTAPQIPELSRLGAGKRIVDGFVGHGVQIDTTALSPDGRLLATSARDHRLLLWDVGSRRFVGELPPHGDVVAEMAFSPDGRYLATSTGVDGQACIRVLSVADRRLLASKCPNKAIARKLEFKGTHNIRVEWNDAKQSNENWRWRTKPASSSGNKVAGDLIPKRRLPDRIRTESSRLTVVTDDSGGFTIKRADSSVVWRLSPGVRMCALDFDARSGSLITAECGQHIRVHDPRTGAVTRRFRVGGNIESVSVARNGGRAAVVLREAIALYDLRTGKRISRLKRPKGPGKGVHGLAICPDGGLVAWVDFSSTVTVLDAATGVTVQRLRIPGVKHRSVAFSPDGKSLVVASWDGRASANKFDRQLHFIDVSQNRVVRSVPHAVTLEVGLAFLPARRVVVGGAMSRGLEIVDTARPGRNRVLGPADAEVFDVSRDGKHLAAVGEVGKVELRDVPTGKLVRQLRGSPGWGSALAFSPRGTYLAALWRNGSVWMFRVRSR
jgi:WD40 repeat protein